MARKRDDDDTLGFDLPGDRMGPGRVYQGVCKEIRERIEAGTLERDLAAGAIAAARSIARSIDHASGHNPRGTVAAGMQLAALHAQLLAWLDKLGGPVAEDDPLNMLARKWQEEEEERGRATAPHTTQ